MRSGWRASMGRFGSTSALIAVVAAGVLLGIPVGLTAAALVDGRVPPDVSLLPSPTGSAAATPPPSTDPGSPVPSASGPTTPPTPAPTPAPTSTPAAPPAAGDYLLISRAALLARPTSGSAWTALLAVADGSLGSADLCDQDSKHGVRTLGTALVYARIGGTGYRTKARDAIMAAIGTVRVGCNNAILALGRQLGAYVLAADLIGLSGSDETTFRSWLSKIRTRDLGGHGRWRQLRATHEDSPNNWGAFAGASRIAASLYLDDAADLGRAARVFHGFVGDRSAWSDWGSVDDESQSWSCDPRRFVPLNGACVRNGIDIDGAIPADASRNGSLEWPPGHDAQLYQIESLQGLIVQAELLSRAGYPAWTWEDSALARAAAFATRADAWNLSSVAYHVPWLLNARYGLDLPTRPAGFGRVFGFTDWLYDR